MNLKYVACALLLGAAVMLTGCTTEYDKKDIKSYVDDNLNLEDYTVSSDYTESEDKDGYTDRIWTVVDDKNDLTFHVIDNYGWGAESTTNYLYDDYEASVLIKYQDRFSWSESADTGTIHVTSGANSQGINEVSLNAAFTNRAELQTIFKQLAETEEILQDLGFEKLSPSTKVCYKGPDSSPCRGHLVGASEVVHGNSDADESFHNLMQAYILAGLDYRFEEVISDTTQAERQEAILADDTYRVGIVRENGETEYYDDLVGCVYGYGLNVSTLYHVLDREGLHPVGDERDFTCVGADGKNYEFSCDFTSREFDGDAGSYYLADGEAVKLGFAYNIHITASMASELFGISIVTDTNQEIAESTEE